MKQHWTMHILCSIFFIIIFLSSGISKAEVNSNNLSEKLAVHSDRFKACAGTDSRGARLLCFDQLSADLGLREKNKLHQELNIVGEFGLWEGTVAEGEFGEKKYYFKLLPDELIEQRSPSPYSQPQLVVMCQNQKSQVYLDWKDKLRPYLHDKKKVVIEYKVSSQASFNEYWNLSTDNYAAFSPTPIELLKALKGKSKLLLRFPTERLGGQSTVFSIDGIDAIIDSIVENCYQ